ncbi:alpha/beta hydrolase [Desulfarculus baarsii]
MSTNAFMFQGPGQGQLAGRLFLPQGPPRAKVVIAHGLQSSMASQKLTNLALFLAERGMIAMQFDHSGCGESPGEMRLTTLSGRRDELVAAARALPEDDAPLVLVGSSMGGTAALLAAAALAPACLAVWSAPWDYLELMARLATQDPPPDLPLMPRDIMSLDLEAALARRAGVLFVHGQDDEVVPVAQARRGHDLARQPKDLLIIAGADHRLSRLADQKLAMARTLAWIERFIA